MDQVGILPAAFQSRRISQDERCSQFVVENDDCQAQVAKDTPSTMIMALKASTQTHAIWEGGIA